MTENEIVEKLDEIIEELKMGADEYIEMVSKKHGTKLSYVDIWPYMVGSALASVEILRDHIAVDQKHRNGGML